MAKKETVNLAIEVDTTVRDDGVNPYRRSMWLAKTFDAWRIFPRIFISVYIYLLYEVVMWFMHLDTPTMEQAGLVSVIVGAGAAWFGLYVNSRGDKETVSVPAPTGSMYSGTSSSKPGRTKPSRPSAPAYGGDMDYEDDYREVEK